MTPSSIRFRGNKAAQPSKPCTACGLAMTWRKRWAKNWAGDSRMAGARVEPTGSRGRRATSIAGYGFGERVRKP